MAYELYEDPCEGSVADPECDPCLDSIELGGVRGVSYIHKSYYPTVKADPENPTVWAAGRAAGLIKVIPQTNGTSDGGQPVEVPGFGDLVTKVIGYNFQIVYKDPVLKANTAFYNTISRSSAWHLAYRTETLTRISDKPCTVIPSAPVEEDKTSQVTWNVTVKFQQRDHSVMFDTPEGVFDCTSAPPAATLSFLYGATPLDTTGEDVLDDADYTGSVADEDATELTGEFIDGGDITINSFSNTEDQVLYIKPPAGQAPFTKFSVVGNELQQNVPIDVTISGSSGIFKSSDFYFTRSQTTLDGPLVLSR